MSTVSASVRRLVIERDRGMCVRCPRARPFAQVHHRRARGMGSSNRGSTNQASNLVCLCLDHHAWAESHRSEALDLGYLVPQSQEPAQVPILYRGRLVLLGDDGLLAAA